MAYLVLACSLLHRRVKELERAWNVAKFDFQVLRAENLNLQAKRAVINNYYY